MQSIHINNQESALVEDNPVPPAPTSNGLRDFQFTTTVPQTTVVPSQSFIAEYPSSAGELYASIPDAFNFHEHLGPDMLRILAGIKAQVFSDVLPKELSIIVNDVSSDMPTHMFAGFSSIQPAAARRRAKLILAQCADQEIKVPVAPLCIPTPKVFPQLSTFLYTKRIDPLLGSFLPLATLPQLYRDDPTTFMPLLTQFAQKIADTYAAKTLLQHIAKVHDTWRKASPMSSSGVSSM
ncbi:hypothetical protein EDB19DRAFT_1904490 [Suillus lakei]|nr:hypothetical protein EDB19DRAFT_1904490 [Suillus lakei]